MLISRDNPFGDIVNDQHVGILYIQGYDWKRGELISPLAPPPAGRVEYVGIAAHANGDLDLVLERVHYAASMNRSAGCNFRRPHCDPLTPEAYEVLCALRAAMLDDVERLQKGGRQRKPRLLAARPFVARQCDDGTGPLTIGVEADGTVLLTTHEKVVRHRLCTLCIPPDTPYAETYPLFGKLHEVLVAANKSHRYYQRDPEVEGPVARH